MKKIRSIAANKIIQTVTALVVTAAVIARVYSAPTQATNAFPGAVGFGANTIGGRGGVILQVTSCADSGAGTLREAVNKTGPRIVIFKVACLIELSTPLIIKNPYITIAGQTGNVAFKRDGFDVRTHDVIIRGLRVRVGDVGGSTDSRDSIKLNSWGGDAVYNVIVDHSSFVWGIDENISASANLPLGSNPVYDVTFSNNIIAEGLHCSVHVKLCHSMGGLMYRSNNISVYKNLLANNWARNLFLSDTLQVDFVNNVIYGWGDYSLMLRDKNTVNIIGNYFKSASYSKAYEIMNEGSNTASRYYKSGNIADYNGGQNAVRIKGTLNWLAAPAFPGLPAVSAQQAYLDVLNYAGGVRDAVDLRIVTNVRNRTGAIINSQTQVGGWPSYNVVLPSDTDSDGLPDTFEGSVNLDPLALAPSGYMWIEEWFNGFFDAPTLTPTATPIPTETATSVPSATPTASATETPAPTAIPTGTPIVIFCDKPCKIIIEEQ